jgi:cell wall-associated NlpC family hydrolase
MMDIIRWIFRMLLEEKAKPVVDGPSFSTSIELGTWYDRQKDEDEKRALIVSFCKSQIGKKYQLGVEVKEGEETEFWDCSEMVQLAYSAAGMTIPDGSPYQMSHCKPVKGPKAGDLGFLWSDKWNRIGHVFVSTGNLTVIHAVGGRGVVEDVESKWALNPRFRGWRRHPDFAWPKEERCEKQY